LILTTGWRREHRNCGSLTCRSIRILWVWLEEAIEICPEDAEKPGVEDGETVLVKSKWARRG